MNQCDEAAAALESLLPFLREKQFDFEKINRFTELCDRLRRDLAPEVRVEVAERLRREAPRGDLIRLHSVLFYLTGDLYHYEHILHYLLLGEESAPPALMHYTYWCMSRQLFLGASAPEKASAFVPCDFYRFYEAMVRSIARRWNMIPPKHEPRPGPIRRAVLVTNQFTNDQHQPSRDCFDYAHRLLERGIDVAILNSNHMPLHVENLFIPPMVADVIEHYEGVWSMEMFGKRVKMASFTDRPFSRDKMAAIVDAIDGFDPDIILSFGGSNIPCDLFADAGARPVVCLPTTSGITISLAPLVLGYDENDFTAGIPAAYRAPFARRFRPFNFGFFLPPSVGQGGDFGVGPADFVFGVVGTRLDIEVDATFLAMLDDVLDRCPGAVVAFAGHTTELAGRVAAARNAARMRCLGHLTDMRAFYQRCGAFLNPSRQGGGGSAAIAIGEGVPVVTLAWGDVASVAGPAFHTPDREAYVTRAAELAADPAFRAAQAAEARARFEGTVDRRHSVDRLLEYCEEARNLFRSKA